MAARDIVYKLCQCPKCNDLMLPPIKMCIRGHTSCNECIIDTRGCPICKEPDRGVRNLLLEKMMNFVSLPCPNTSEGCDYFDVGANLREHLIQCRRIFGHPCPLRAINLCKWKGKTHEMVDHCLKAHKGNCFRTHEQELVCSKIRRGRIGIPTSRGAMYHILFEAYEQLFKMIWDINDETGFLRFTVIALTDNNEDANNYQYTVEFRSSRANKNDVRITDFCQSQDTRYFEDGTYKVSHVDLIKSFSNYYGIYYHVTISRNGQPASESSSKGANYIYHPEPVRYLRDKEDSYE